MRFIPYIVMALMVVGGLLYVKNLGKIECENEQKTQIIAGEKQRKQINHANKNLKRETLINSLDDGGWLRND